MPFGTVDEVRQMVRERISTLGTGGGLILAPRHFLESGVSWENIVALFEVTEECGHYS